MIGLRRGMGSTDVQAIAQAQRAGQLSNLNFQSEYFQPTYLPSGQMAALPSNLYIDDAGASLIASLLDGSVFQGNPPGNYQNAPGTTIPPANWVRLSDGGTVLPGNLIQPGTVLAFQDVCDAETYFANSIPGGELSSDCGGQSNPLIAGNGLPSPALPYISPTNPIIPVPVLPTTPVTVDPTATQSSGSSPILANPGTAAGAPPATTPPAANNTTVATTVTGFNPLSAWFNDPLVSASLPIGYWELGIAAAALLYLFSKGGSR